MYILDTDHLSLTDEDSIEAFNIGRRLARIPANQVLVTIITYEEQMRGWLSYLAKARGSKQQIEAYARLRHHVERFQGVPLLDYNSEADDQFNRLRAQGVRIGTMDLKIAAIALANDAVLLSRNLKDFSKVPGIRVEDWSV